MTKLQFNFFILSFVALFASCTKNSSENKIEGAQADAKLSLVDRGKALVETKGCVACHTVSGARMVGPSFKAIFNSETKLNDGTSVKVDEQYIRESIENPMVKIVAGFSPSMPAYKGILKEEEIVAITEYIKSLK